MVKSKGITGHHSKHYMHLNGMMIAMNNIRGVELNTTRTGMVSITGLFDEIDIDGVKISEQVCIILIFLKIKLGIEILLQLSCQCCNSPNRR